MRKKEEHLYVPLWIYLICCSKRRPIANLQNEIFLKNCMNFFEMQETWLKYDDEIWVGWYFFLFIAFLRV